MKPDLLKELLENTNRPQETPKQTNSDAMNLLLTSALMANGSVMTFIDSLFTASQALAQAGTPVSPYPSYPLTLGYNQDMEFSFNYPSRNNSLESVISPVNEEHSTHLEDSFTSQATAQNRIATIPHTHNSNSLISNCELESPSKWLSTSTSSLDSLLPSEAESSPDTNNTSTSSKEPPDQIKAVITEGILETKDLQVNSTPEDSSPRTHPISIPSHEPPQLDIRSTKSRPSLPAPDPTSSLEQKNQSNPNKMFEHEFLEFERLCSIVQAQALPQNSTARSPYQNLV